MKTAEIKIESVSPVKKKLQFEIPWEEVKKELEAAYQTVGRKAKIKGFRPGKTPRRLLELYFKDQAEGEAISNLVNRTYIDALKHHSINAVTEPEIDQKGIEAEKSFVYEATVEIEPEFEPKDYTGLSIEKEDDQVTEQDVNGRIEELRQMYSTLKDLEEDRGIVEGDFALIDFEGRLDGNLRKELSEANYSVTVGSKRLVPGFEEQLIGLKSGESKDFKITFPPDYPGKEFAGKEVDFHATIRGIKVKVLPDVDDNFVKNFDKYDSMEALREDIRKSAREEKEGQARGSIRKALMDKLLENNVFEVPSAYVERQIFSMMVDTQRRMVYGGMDPEKATDMAVKLHDRFKDNAERIVKSTLILQKIAEKESIAVDDKELEEKLKEIYARHGKDYESADNSEEQQNMMESLRQQMLEEKTLDFIQGKTHIMDKKAK